MTEENIDPRTSRSLDQTPPIAPSKSAICLYKKMLPEALTAHNHSYQYREWRNYVKIGKCMRERLAPEKDCTYRVYVGPKLTTGDYVGNYLRIGFRD